MCYNMGVRAAKLPTTFKTMAAINCLSIREENELCVAIAAELADYIQSGEVSHQLIRETLRNCVAMYGNCHTDDFFVDKVIFQINWRPQSLGPLRK